MNIKDLNEQMRTAYHAAGHKGRGIIFAVLDTGVKPMLHLEGRVLLGTTDGDKDKIGHGTAVAGILAEWCPEAQILAYKVFDDAGHGNTHFIIECLQKVLKAVRDDKEHQYVVNMSLSAALDPDGDLAKRYIAAVDALVAAGVPVFSAGGNDGKEVLNKFPACIPAVIAASAVDENCKWGNFSTWNNEIDFAGLGVNRRTLSINTGSGYGIKSGTSIACPEVAGLGALLMSAFNLTEPKMYELMKKLAIDLGDGGRDPYFGWGVVDIKTPATALGVSEGGTGMKIYLSASTQEGNPCYQLPGISCKTEEQHCQALLDLVAPRLQAHGFQTKRNSPEMDYASSYKAGNAWGAEMYICFHTNGSTNPAKRGAYWAYITQGGKNKGLAQLLAERTSMDGVKVSAVDKTSVSGFGELDLCTAKHAAYAELGYHSSPDDHAWLHRNMTAIVEGIVRAVCDYTGTRYVAPGEQTDPAPTPEPDPTPVPEQPTVGTLPALYFYGGATFVNVRSGPGTSHAVVGKLSAGQKCIVLALADGWAEVVLHEAVPMVRGWCIDTYLRRA